MAGDIKQMTIKQQYEQILGINVDQMAPYKGADAQSQQFHICSVLTPTQVTYSSNTKFVITETQK